MKEKKIEVRDRRGKERFYLDDAYLNGYAKICGIYATGVYISLCRHADQSQKCWPSIRRIAEELSISQTQVRRAIKILEQRNIIKKERLGKKLNNRYWLLNKSEWSGRTLSDRPDRTLNPAYQDTHPLPDRTLHSKETHSKETHSKEDATLTVAVTEPLQKGIQELLTFFYEKINPSLRFENKTTRKAAAWLVEKLGIEKAIRTAEYAVSIQGQPYAPVITTPYELKEKLSKLVIFQKQQNQTGRRGTFIS